MGVRFKPAGKVYDFDCGAYVLSSRRPGDGRNRAGAQPRHGGDRRPGCWKSPRPSQPFKKVYRLATAEGSWSSSSSKAADEQAAHAFCRRMHQGARPAR
ncbi:MAG: hypothetical protein MZV70_50775 [Desulfobacterales bacterium]|nr:hypothetical protein [Desulfobacterales bacterium]